MYTQAANLPSFQDCSGGGGGAEDVGRGVLCPAGMRGPVWVTVQLPLSPQPCPVRPALCALPLTAVLALVMSSICRCRSSISTSIAFRAFTAAAQVNSDSSSWT